VEPTENINLIFDSDKVTNKNINLNIYRPGNTPFKLMNHAVIRLFPHLGTPPRLRNASRTHRNVDPNPNPNPNPSPN